MAFANAVATRIGALNEWIGRALSWLTLALVLLVFGLVAARYAFAIGSVAAQEAALWLHSLVFLLGAAFTLKRDAHVRVDLVYQRFSPRGKKRWPICSGRWCCCCRSVSSCAGSASTTSAWPGRCARVRASRAACPASICSRP
jgi:TRAP-type C4-dicarboxylate transport system permease small subunit